MKRVLVIGAAGALGAEICSALEAVDAIEVVKASRAKGDTAVDVASAESIHLAVQQIDVVVVAAPQRDPVVQRVCAERAIPCVDVSPHGQLLRQVQNELQGITVPSVVMCGFFPGLSGILAAHVVQELKIVDEVSVALVQSANAKVGPTGVKDMLRKISQPVSTRGGELPGFRYKKQMRFGNQKRTVRRIHYDEQEFLTERLGVSEIGYYTAWSSPALTAVIAGMKRLGVLALLARSSLQIAPKHNPRKPQNASLMVEAKSLATSEGETGTRTIRVEACSDYGATALVTACVVRYMVDHQADLAGVLLPMDFIRLEDMAWAFGKDRMSLWQ